MDSEANKQLYRDFIDAGVNRGDLGELDKYLDPGYHDHHRYVEGIPEGAEGEKLVLAMIREAFTNPRLDLEIVMADGDLVLGYGMFSAVHTGNYAGIPPTNKEFSVAAFDIVRIKDGKLTEHWGMIDSASMMAQLGLT